MSIPARVTLRPSGRVVLTNLPHHPRDERDMIIRDGETAIRIHVTAYGDSPAETARGPLLVEADEL
jgi:hypothetical protein